MSRVTPQIGQLAAQLVAHETKRTKIANPESPPAFLVVEKLRLHLATLMGNTGFRALLSRALALAMTEGPWLRVVQIELDGSLKWKNEINPPIETNKLLDGTTSLIAHLLGLLSVFVGESLTLQVVNEVWPNLNQRGPRRGQGEIK